jgi:hypothetical protein
MRQFVNPGALGPDSPKDIGYRRQYGAAGINRRTSGFQPHIKAGVIDKIVSSICNDAIMVNGNRISGINVQRRGQVISHHAIF